ncbi:hypothetical protein KY345_06425 [Candidatus Woesearchaeota archaeon]|nr:hypothetical protein [Candidatus Woesearchaeota archaeon]
MKRLFRNKRGIEITINFIVMLILALAVLSGSLILIRKFFISAEETKASIDSQTQSQIRSMLIGGAKVAIPINRVTAHRGDFVTFGVGILNVLNRADSDDFMIIANNCSGAIKIGSHIPEQTAPVKNNDQKIFLVGYKIERNVPLGTYICNIQVLYDKDEDTTIDYNPVDDYIVEPGTGDDYYAETVYKAYIVIE